MTVRGPQLSYDLLVGDYLQVGTDRISVYGRGVDAGFARIERIEHVPDTVVGEVFSSRLVADEPVPVVWCHHVPGPVVLIGGDVHVLDHTSPARVEHDTANPYWPAHHGVLLRGAVRAGDRPVLARREPGLPTEPVNWPTPSLRSRAPHRATRFAKPASALRIGDYLGLHTDRWPISDHDVDEGFSRVEHLRILDRDAADTLFADLEWHTTIIVVGVHGLAGVLLLRGGDEVTVLAFVNPEREAFDRRDPWVDRPMMEFTGSRLPNEAEQRAAGEADATRRPRVDEASWYPSRFSDPIDRRMAMESLHGFRTVSLSALPWPHRQTDCAMGDIATTQRQATPDGQAAHAAAFRSPQGQRVMASCRYHRADWPRLIRILSECLDRADDPDDVNVDDHPEHDHLSGEDKRWLLTLVTGPIRWDDGEPILTDGQHRLCALRAAGVDQCPVTGNHLPDTTYAAPTPAAEHARETITASWRTYGAKHGWPPWVGMIAAAFPRALRAHLLDRGDDPRPPRLSPPGL